MLYLKLQKQQNISQCKFVLYNIWDILPVKEIYVFEIHVLLGILYLLANPGHHTLEGGTDLLRTTAQQATLKTPNQTSSIWNHDPKARAASHKQEGQAAGASAQLLPSAAAPLSMHGFSHQKLFWGSVQTRHSAKVYLSFCLLSVITLFLFLKIIIHYSF